MSAAANVTTLLEAIERGDAAALQQLFGIVYQELHAIAGRERARWRGNYTINTTGLVHEAYLKLAHVDRVKWESRRHFFAVAARAMRQVLVNYARDRQAQRRGGAYQRVEFGESLASAQNLEDVLVLDDLLTTLARASERQCKVFECRFFAGLSVEETAGALGVSPATVKRDWSFASAWLYQQMSGASS